MKQKMEVIAVTLLVKSEVALPIFATAPASVANLFPGIFSIELHPCGYYAVQVSTLTMFSALQDLNQLAQASAKKH